MITVKDVVYSVGEKTILDGVNLTLTDNEKAGLVGVNGAGKSTLFRVMMGEVAPESGSVIFSSATRSIGYMPQTLECTKTSVEQGIFDFLLSGRPVRKIEEEMRKLTELISACRNEEECGDFLKELAQLQDLFNFWGGYSAEDELLRIVDGMSLGGLDLDMAVSELSGGQKSKVNFARVLYSRPDVLLLDEPTNHLDKESRNWLKSYLVRYPGSVLIISHDRDFLDATVSKIIHLDGCTKIAETFAGSYSHYLEVWQQNLDARRCLARKQEREIDRLKSFIDDMRGVSGKRKRQAQSREKMLEKLLENRIEDVGRVKQRSVRIMPKRECQNTPLHVMDVHFGYLRNKEVIHGASFLLSKNEKFVVVGKNGTGKSTLLKLIVGKIKPWKGVVNMASRTDVGYYAQEHEDLSLENNIIEEVSGVSSLGQSQLRSVLGRFRFSGEKVFQKIGTLSPGERSRLALAKLSLEGANLLVLDEPTNHLDLQTSKIIAEALRDYGGTVIVVSHDVEFLETLGVERMLFLPDCKVEYYSRLKVEQFQDEK